MIDAEHMTQKNLVKFKATMLNASLCDYSDAYILAKEAISVVGQGTDVSAITADRNDKQVAFKNCALFITCKIKINYAEVDDAEDLGVVIPIFNLLGYSDNYTETDKLWQYQRNEPDDDNITYSKSFKLSQV